MAPRAQKKQASVRIMATAPSSTAAGALRLRDHHRDGVGQALAQHHQQGGGGARGPYGGQCLHTDKPAHHHSVRHVVHLLEYAADEHGDGEQHQQPDGAALGHIQAFGPSSF